MSVAAHPASQPTGALNERQANGFEHHQYETLRRTVVVRVMTPLVVSPSVPTMAMV